MEMKLTFAPFVFSPGGRKLLPPYKTASARAYPPESLPASIARTDAVSLSRMSLSSLLYYALMGDNTATS